VINNIYLKLNHVQGFTLEKPNNSKNFVLNETKKTIHPFQAYVKSQNRNTTQRKFLPKFLEQFKNTDFGIHFLVKLASGVF